MKPIRYRAISVFLAGIVLAGCAITGTDGIVPIGPDMYMVGGLGKFTDYSGSETKARLFKQAAQFCIDKNQVMVPMNSTGTDAGMGTYASAEIQFRCLNSNDSRLRQ